MGAVYWLLVYSGFNFVRGFTRADLAPGFATAGVGTAIEVEDFIILVVGPEILFPIGACFLPSLARVFCGGGFK